MLCPWSPRHAGSPRDTLHFQGQLLARLSRCVPVPPAGLLPGQAVHRRLCSAAGEGSGLVLEGAWRELAAVSLLAKCACPSLPPGRGRGRSWTRTGDRRRQLCSPEPRLQQQLSSGMGGLISSSLSMGILLQLVRPAPIPVLSCPVPRAGVLLDDTWVLLTPLAVLLVPCAQCRQQRNMVMPRQSK